MQSTLIFRAMPSDEGRRNAKMPTGATSSAMPSDLRKSSAFPKSVVETFCGCAAASANGMSGGIAAKGFFSLAGEA